MIISLFSSKFTKIVFSLKRMSRTSLGQKNQINRREQIKQLGSQYKGTLEDKYHKPYLQFNQQIENFLFLKDKYNQVERENQYNVELGETYSNVNDDFGIFVFANGDKYIGEWKKGKMEGMGVYLFNTENTMNRLIYLGEFLGGNFHGFGKLGQFQQLNGQTIYIGEWSEGRKHNLGLHYYQNPQTYYFGNWIQDQKHGEGKLVFSGGQFTGNWINNRREGLGKLTKKINNRNIVYQGQWLSDDLHLGTVVYYDEFGKEIGWYEGDFQQGKKHGKGIYQWSDALYDGEFSNDKIKGVGLLKSGRINLKGEFSSDDSNNDLNFNLIVKGLLSYDQGDRFDGMVSIKDGTILRLRGLYSFANGDSADGEFMDNPTGELRGRYVYRWSNGQSKQYDS